jgi:hypothetical protein
VLDEPLAVAGAARFLTAHVDEVHPVEEERKAEVAIDAREHARVVRPHLDGRLADRHRVLRRPAHAAAACRLAYTTTPMITIDERDADRGSVDAEADQQVDEPADVAAASATAAEVAAPPPPE